VAALRRIGNWPGDAQFTLAAAVILVIGPLLPWLSYPGAELSPHYSGIELNAGLLCVVAGTAATLLLIRPEGPRVAATSGALPILALVAGGLVLQTFIKHLDDPIAPLWGLYVTGLAALALLVGWFLLQAESDPGLGPPD
jgi:hypothetical protein